MAFRTLGSGRYPEVHDRTDEFFSIVVDIPVGMLVTGHCHRLDESLPEVVDKARLSPGHVGEKGLEDALVGQNPPFKVS